MSSEEYEFEYDNLVKANEASNKQSISRQYKMIADIRELQAEKEVLETNRDVSAQEYIELQAELEEHKKVIDEVYDKTVEGYVIEMIDVLRGDAVWDEDGAADYIEL